MPKIVLGSRPKNFKRLVKFPMLDGTVGQISMHYKYRTRAEFGELIDSRVNAARDVKVTDGADDDIRPSALGKTMQEINEANAEYVLEIAEGWDLESPFSKESLLQLSDEVPGAVMSIMNEYQRVIQEGRLGN